MSMRICLEEDYVLKTLAKSKKNDLAVVDIDNIDPKYVREAVSRGVHVYGYLNACALEKERSYYDKFKDLRIARYSGWPGEYWVDVTDERWQKHLIDEAKRFKEAGCKGLYFDNPDLYYMCIVGFREKNVCFINPAPRGWHVYEALLKVMNILVHDVGLVVMPNGGDLFVKKLINNGHRDLVKTVIQESVLFNNNKRVSKEDKEYFTEYLNWCKEEGIYIRGIEYCTKFRYKAEAKAYYKKHGWQGLYISPHSDLRGD
jgi:endo-alpha-1,4-polygalactosaminidase (GH114 family)